MSDEPEGHEAPWAAEVAGSSAATAADSDPGHLFPPFRAKVARLLEALEAKTGEPWVVAEGYRTQARQTWLYAQGRTRPGPVVTWKRNPTWHGTGQAADLRPRRGYNCPREWWIIKHALEPQFGLKNPPYSAGDLGHVQDATPNTPKAAAWVKAGFPPERVPVRVYYTGALVLGINAYVEQGRSYGVLKALTRTLDLTFGPPAKGVVTVMRHGTIERKLPARIEDGRTVIALGDLMRFPDIRVDWDGEAVQISG